MKVHQQPAYLLHTRPYSESSLLVDVFSKEYGRLMLLAKGARRRKSRTRGVLLPFQLLLASWSGKGALPILTSVEQSGGYQSLRSGNLASGFYVNELLLILLHRFDAHETLFEHYRRAIDRLHREQSPVEALRVFEKNLLHDIGFGAALERDCETGEAISRDLYYRYVPDKGAVCADENNAASANTEPSFDAALRISGRALHALREERFESENDLLEARRLTRVLLERQLNGRALRSRRVLREMNKYIESPR